MSKTIQQKIDYLFSKINWKDSALDAEAIDDMNTVKIDIAAQEKHLEDALQYLADSGLEENFEKWRNN